MVTASAGTTAFSREAQVAEWDGDLARTVRVSGDLLDLAGAVRRGGMIMDAQVSGAFEAIAIKGAKGKRLTYLAAYGEA